MADINFIELGKEPRYIERQSVFLNHYEFKGVQLLPFNELPYSQVTNVAGGINLEDRTAYIVDCDGNETDISLSFAIDDIFTDVNGDNQIVWSLTNVPFDFGYEFVYLKVVQTIGETFYSNKFMLTDYESEKTSRLDYKGFDSDYYQSTQLLIAFKQAFNPVEIETYYEVSTRNTVINTVKSQKYENWLTGVISNDLLLKLIEVFTYKYTYIDLIRCNLFEAIEQKEIESEENFEQNLIKLTFNKSEVFEPVTEYLPPFVPLVPVINLVEGIVDFNNNNVLFVFNLSNFITQPDFLTLQRVNNNDFDEVIYSLNIPSETNYLSTNIDFGLGLTFWKISHPLAVSNIIEVDLS